MSGVVINSTGKFTGTAGTDGTPIGRISFDCENCTVITDWRPVSARHNQPKTGGVMVGNTAQLIQGDGVSEVNIQTSASGGEGGGRVQINNQEQGVVQNDASGGDTAHARGLFKKIINAQAVLAKVTPWLWAVIAFVILVFLV